MHKILLIQPMGRLTFYQHHYLGDVLFTAKRDQQMQVFRPSSNTIKIDVLCTAVKTNVLVQLPTDLARELRLVISRAENNMNPDANI